MRKQTLLQISILCMATVFSDGCALGIDVLPVMREDLLKRLDLEHTGDLVGDDRRSGEGPMLEVVFERADFDTTTYELALKGCVVIADPDVKKRRIDTAWIHAGALRTYYRATKTDEDAPLREDDEMSPVPDDDSYEVLKPRQFLSSGPDGCFDIVINVQGPSDHVRFLAPELKVGTEEAMASSSLYAIGMLLTLCQSHEDQSR